MAVRQTVPVRAVPVRGPAQVLPYALVQLQRLAVVVAAVLAVLTPVLQAADVALPGRAVLAVLFVVLVPGAPLVVLLRLRSQALYLAMTFAVSISTMLLLSTLLVETRLWQPLLGVFIQAVLGLGLTLPAWWALPRTPRAGTGRAISLDRERLLGLAAVLGSLALWVVAVNRVDLDATGALGLARQVGPFYWLGLALLAVVAARQLTALRPDALVLICVVVALTIEMFGFLNAADSASSISTGWLHVGFARYIAEHGDVAHYYDARMSWPAFFASAAVLTDASGFKDAVPFLKPAPVIDLLLVLPALWSLAHTITRSVPLAWLALFTFLSIDWYGQDYFSPQATVFVLYLAVLAMLMHLAPPAQVVDGPDVPWRHPFIRLRAAVPLPKGEGPGLQLAREAVVVLLCAAVVVSHQLTPLNLLVTLVLLVLTGATRMRGLWLLVGLIFIGWFTLGASEYWRSNIGAVFGDIGQVGSTVNTAVGGRLDGDPVHQHMQTLRLAWAAGSVVLALVTVWRMRRTTWVWLLAGLSLGPFSIVLIQSYGGEVALRCFLYADPVLAPLMALTVWWVLGKLPRRLLRSALTVALLLGFTVLTLTRGSNASFERETSADLAAAQHIFDSRTLGAPPKTIGLVEFGGFAGFEDVTEWAPVSLDPASCDGQLDLQGCVRKYAPDYVLMTKTMDNLGVLQDGQRAGWTERLADTLTQQRLYTKTFERGGAIVLQRVGAR